MGQKAPNAEPESSSQTGDGRLSGSIVPEAARRLAKMFATEPELISACLHGVETQPPTWTQTVLDAALLALAKHPHYADLNYYGSQAAVAAGEYDTAARLLAQALHVNAGYREARVLAGRVALLRQRPQEACAHLETAVALGADFPDVHLLLGDVWRACGNWSRARQSLARALELNAGLAAAGAALAALPPAETTRGEE
jgi:tetratricopeptide (TPR) repeat protein